MRHPPAPIAVSWSAVRAGAPVAGGVRPAAVCARGAVLALALLGGGGAARAEEPRGDAGLQLAATLGLAIGRTETPDRDGPGSLIGPDAGLRVAWCAAGGLCGGLAVGAFAGPSQAGGADGHAAVALAEVGGRPWPALLGPLTLRFGLGVGRFEVAPDGASAPEGFRLSGFGLAVRGGVSYALWGAAPAGQGPGFAFGPSAQVTHLPFGRDGDALTWVSLGFEGRWSAGR